MAGYEIWIIYLQTGHKSDPVLEVNAHLVFKAYCLSMKIHILVYTFFITQLCGLSGDFGRHNIYHCSSRMLALKMCKKAAFTGDGF